MTTMEDVARIAELSRLDIDPDKLESVAANFSEILDHIKRLNLVDTSGVDPVYHATVVLKDVLAEDVHEPSGMVLDEVIKSAPKTRENQFQVPKVIE